MGHRAPAQVEGSDLNVVFLDTEGLSSTVRGETYDVNIFALSVLLSSMFVYNSKGTIDGDAISKLSLVVNLTRHIQMSASAGDEDGTRFKEVFPSFVWVVRDFGLKLEKNGRKLKPREYLDDALEADESGGMTEEGFQKNLIKQQIREFFPTRDCVPMVQPVVDEEKLQKLQQVPDEELKPQFLKALQRLRSMVVEEARPKIMFGQAVNGAMLGALAQQYVEAINDSKAPVISSAWQRVVESQCTKAVEAALHTYKAHMAQQVADAEGHPAPQTVLHLLKIHTDAQAKSQAMFASGAVSDPEELPKYTQQLAASVAAEFGTTVRRNTELSDLESEKALAALLPQFQARVLEAVGGGQGGDTGSVDSDDSQPRVSAAAGGPTAPTVARAFQSSVDWLRAEYSKQATGPAASGVLAAALSDPSGIVLGTLGTHAAASRDATEAHQRSLRAQLGEAQHSAEMLGDRASALQKQLEAERATHTQAMASARQVAVTTEEALQSQLAAAEDESERWSRKVDNLKESFDNSTSRLHTMVDEANQDAKRAQQALSAAQAEALKEARSDTVAAAKLQAATEDLSAARVQVATLQGTLQAAQGQASAARELAASREGELETLHEQVALLFDAVQTQKDLVAARTQEKEDAEYEWGSAKSQLKMQEAEYLTLQDELDALQSATHDLALALQGMAGGKAKLQGVTAAFKGREMQAYEKAVELK